MFELTQAPKNVDPPSQQGQCLLQISALAQTGPGSRVRLQSSVACKIGRVLAVSKLLRPARL